MSLSLSQVANLNRLIEALRSGEFTQAKKQLRIGDSFCCLGVACDISDLGNWIKDRTNLVYSVGLDSSSLTVLPEEVRKYYGFPLVTGFRLSHITDKKCNFTEIFSDHFDDWLELTSLNDDVFTFSQIADVIEYWKDNQEVIENATPN